MKSCSVCGVVKEFIEFQIWRTNKTGMTPYYSRTCRPCQRRTYSILKGLKLKHPYPPSGTPCALCLRIDKLHMDHDHASGEFRGFVCRNCNCGLGHLGDSEKSIQRALQYLQRCKPSMTDSGGQVLVNSEPLLSEKA